MEELAPNFNFIMSNDPDGDCSTTITLRFSSKEEAVKVFENSENLVVIPINTNKHIYTEWEPIIQKRGAFHPLMNPFNMEVNKHINYSLDMCPKSLELLSVTGHVAINPDWTIDEIKKIAKTLTESLNK